MTCMMYCFLKEIRGESNMAVCEVHHKKDKNSAYRANISIDNKRRTKDFPFTKEGLEAALALSKEWETEKLLFKHEKMSKNLISRRGLLRGISFGTYFDSTGFPRGVFPIHIKGVGKALVAGIHINSLHDFDESYDMAVKKILRYMKVKKVTPEVQYLIDTTKEVFWKKFKKNKCKV